MRVSRHKYKKKKKIVVLGDFLKVYGGYLWKGKFYKGKFTLKKHFGDDIKMVHGGYILFGKKFKGKYNHMRHSVGHYVNKVWKDYPYKPMKDNKFVKVIKQHYGHVAYK
jgi:hypothetical protein